MLSIRSAIVLLTLLMGTATCSGGQPRQSNFFLYSQDSRASVQSLATAIAHDRKGKLERGAFNFNENPSDTIVAFNIHDAGATIHLRESLTSKCPSNNRVLVAFVSIYAHGASAADVDELAQSVYHSAVKYNWRIAKKSPCSL